MAAALGNQYHKLRLKHGRDSIVTDANKLLENFEEYYQWIMDNPILVKDWVGKEAREVEKEIIMPILKPGLALKFGLKKWESVTALKEKGEDFMEIITHIESAIKNHNITYAAAGLLNSNIIARVESLSENSNVSHTISEMPDWMKDE